MVSQAEKRDELLARIPTKETNEQVQWVWMGILIELDQYVPMHLFGFIHSFTKLHRHALRSDIRAMGSKPSLEDRTKIQERQDSLQGRVEAFHQQALRFMNLEVLPSKPALQNTLEDIGQDLEETDDEDFFLELEPAWEDEDEDPEVSVEHMVIPLPSSFTTSKRAQMGLGRVAAVEAELREGQANDALEAL